MQEEIKNPETVEETVKDEETNKKEKKKNKKSDAEIAELKEIVIAREKEIEELNDKYLRLYAEYDNFRRRAAKEREGVYTDAYCDALEAVLPAGSSRMYLMRLIEKGTV